MLNSYLELNSKVIKKTDNSRYGDGNDIRIINLGPIALFSIFKITTSSGKHLEVISHVRIVSLMYKLKTNAKDFYDFSIGFDSRDRRKKELTNNKNVRRKYYLRNITFVIHQQRQLQ